MDFTGTFDACTYVWLINYAFGLSYPVMEELTLWSKGGNCTVVMTSPRSAAVAKALESTVLRGAIC